MKSKLLNIRTNKANLINNGILIGIHLIVLILFIVYAI